MTNPIQKLGQGTIINNPNFIIADLSLDFIMYEIIFDGLMSIINTADINLSIRTSTNNGATFAGSTDDYIHDMQRCTGGGGAVPHYPWTNANFGLVINSLTNTEGYTNSGSIQIFNPMNPNAKTIMTAHSGGVVKVGSPGTSIQNTVSVRSTAEANNAIQLLAITNGGGLTNFNMNYVIYGYLG